MKKFINLFGSCNHKLFVIILVAVFGLSFTACKPRSTSSSSNGNISGGNSGTITQESNAATSESGTASTTSTTSTSSGSNAPPTPGLLFRLINNSTEYTVSAGTASSGAIVIPASHNDKPVTSISSFSGNAAFTSISLPNTITYINPSAFKNCTGITSINLPNSLTFIGNNAFENCTSLTNITIPSSITEIEMSTFNNCKGLTRVTIGNRVTSIGPNAFENCTGLTSITLPASVVSIGNNAFRGCTNITSVTINGDIPTSRFARNAFVGDIRSKYYLSDSRVSGPGTYTRPDNTSTTWLKN